MLLGQGIDDREPEPRSAGVARTRMIEPVERARQVLEVRFGHARSVVVDTDLDAALVFVDGQRSDKPGTPGRKQQIPRTTQSIWTPAALAS